MDCCVYFYYWEHEFMYRSIKRFLDFTIALVALIVLSPVFLIVALIIKLTSPGPVIFKQKRIGLDGKVFEIYKFRSMVVGAESQGSGVYSGKGDARVTKIGKIIRATSIDELPQFVNILKGEMSFVGPRPPLTYHPWDYSEYSDFQLRMFEVRPGITGWAQVNGRNTITHTKKFEYDVWYVDHLSFTLDMKIILMTIHNVLHRKDISSEGQATAPTFDGTN